MNAWNRAIILFLNLTELTGRQMMVSLAMMLSTRLSSQPSAQKDIFPGRTSLMSSMLMDLFCVVRSWPERSTAVSFTGEAL